MRKLTKKQYLSYVSDYVRVTGSDKQVLDVFTDKHFDKLMAALLPEKPSRVEALDQREIGMNIYGIKMPFYQSSKLCMRF